jgi:hypothetical protein
MYKLEAGVVPPLLHLLSRLSIIALRATERQRRCFDLLGALSVQTLDISVVVRLSVGISAVE